MLFLIAGVAMIIAKALELSYLAEIPWWWCGVPFALAFAYWEFIEPMFSLDAKSETRKEKRRVKKRKQQQMDDLWSEGDSSQKNQGAKNETDFLALEL